MIQFLIRKYICLYVVLIRVISFKIIKTYDYIKYSSNLNQIYKCKFVLHWTYIG